MIKTKRCVRRAMNIIHDASHPHQRLFTLLASGKRFGSIWCRTTRFWNSFFPHATRLLNRKYQAYCCCFYFIPLLYYSLYCRNHAFKFISVYLNDNKTRLCLSSIKLLRYFIMSCYRIEHAVYHGFIVLITCWQIIT